VEDWEVRERCVTGSDWLALLRLGLFVAGIAADGLFLHWVWSASGGWSVWVFMAVALVLESISGSFKRLQEA
jgi:hypothetical protein